MFIRVLSLFVAIWTAAAGFTPLQAAVAAPTNPTIVGLRGKVVTVKVPPGYESVTVKQVVQMRKTRVLRPLASRKPPLAGGTVSIMLRNAVARRAIVVTGTKAESVASSEGAGLRLFLADPALAESSGFRTNYGATSSAVALSSDTKVASASLSVGSSVPAETRSVTESDIWQRSGDRLFFFNQLRGLQVFDVSNPDDPALLGLLREPNRGEQMYLLSSSHVALLTRPSYYFSIYSNPAAAETLDSGAGAVVIADVSAGKPVEVARVPYAGYLVESRLVGTALYVVSEGYTSSGSSLQVTSFDLSDPTAPKKIDTLALGSYGGVINATDRYLFVVRYDGSWRKSIIDVVDISAPNGSLVRRGKMETEGIVGDKFKMNLTGNTLTVVSNVQRDWSIPTSVSRTAIETFDLTRPATPVRLDSISVGEGETVRATRFTDGRLYVVTFFTIDPLWVIDLSDPSNLQVLAELEIPGFSNYIEPLGDRLVAVGRLGSQTAVSLFDVADPANPKVLSQLPIGSGYSYSEANWDEKAFYVNAAHELILVPFSGYNSSNGWAGQMQIISLTRDSLQLRGVINEGFAPRRATAVQNRFIAISSSNLITLDLSNRDQPRVTSNVEIAWRVDRVFKEGSFLVQLGGSAEWNGSAAPTLTVTTSTDPDTALSVRTLADIPVIGATTRAGRLYVAQQHPSWWSPYILDASGTYVPAKNPFVLSVFDISALPAITPLGTVETETDSSASGYRSVQLDPLWVNANTLVWTRPQWTSWWWSTPIISIRPIAVSNVLALAQPTAALRTATLALSAPVPAPPITISSASAVTKPSSAVADYIYLPPYLRDNGGVEMLVFDVTDSAKPKLASTVNPRAGATGDWSTPIAVGDDVFVSYLAYDDPAGVKNGEVSRAYRHFFKKVNLTDPAAPVLSPEVNIPGRLLSVTNSGATLLTIGCRYDADGDRDRRRSFHLSHFDGTTAQLVDQLESPTASDPFATSGSALFIGSYPLGAGQAAQIQAWEIGSDDHFKALGQVASAPFYTLSTFNGLLVGYGAGLPRLFDIRDPATLLDLGAIDTSELTGGDLRFSAGGAGVGIWQPLGASGVGIVTLP